MQIFRSNRPFTVKTQTALVQAVGTQFNVYEQPTGTLVSVLEGQVKVAPRTLDRAAGTNSGPRAKESLSAGEEAQVRPDGTIERNAKADVMKTVAWRERHLIFDDTPLEDMVYEFNRYNQTTRLVLVDIPPGRYHYNGIFDVADPASLGELLSREPDLVVERREGEIVIRRR